MADLALFHDHLWNTCTNTFLAQCSRSGSIKTQQSYRLVLTQFFTSKSKLPPAYTRTDIEMYLARPCDSAVNRGGPPAVATRNWRLTALSSFYKFSGTFYVPVPGGQPHPILHVPAPTLGIRYGKVPLHPHSLSAEELRRLFAVIPTDTVIGVRDRAIFAVYFWTGRRREEIARLRYGDIEETTIVESNGVRRPGWLYRYRGKGHGEQIKAMELPAPAYAAIDRYLVFSGRKAAILPGDALFISTWHSRHGAPDARRPLASCTMDIALKRYVRDAGLDSHQVSLHSFRHSAAVHRYKAGLDLLSIQHFLGHQSVATTQVYLQFLVGMADPGAKLLEAAFAHLS